MAEHSFENGIQPIPQAALAELADRGIDVGDVVAIAGYVGSSTDDAVVRLYPRLDDLAVSVEVAAADILTTADAPTGALPLGGTVLWLRQSAELTVRRSRTVPASSRLVRRLVGVGGVLGPSGGDDRLGIRVHTAAAAVPPIYIPPEECLPCQSTNCMSQCQVCTSR